MGSPWHAGGRRQNSGELSDAAIVCRLASGATVCATRSAGVADADAIRVLLAAEQETTLVAQMNGRIEVLNASLGQAIARASRLSRWNAVKPAPA